MKKILIIILSLAILVVAWFLISPLFVNTTVNEPAVVEAPTMTPQKIEDIPFAMPVTVDIIVGQDVVMDEPMMEGEPEMSIEERGSFVDGDPFHKGEGQVKIITDGDKKFLRFEDFSVTNGPDLFVTLNKGASADRSEYVRVARLKGNKGNQNYDISDYNLDEYESVSIYCRAFDVEFATATL